MSGYKNPWKTANHGGTVGVREVSNVLIRDPKLLRDWEKIAALFDLAGGDIEHFKSDSFSHKPDQRMVKVLEFWISRTGKEATIGELQRMLLDSDFKKCAEDVAELGYDTWSPIDYTSNHRCNTEVESLTSQMDKTCMETEALYWEFSSDDTIVIKGLGENNVTKDLLAAQQVVKDHRLPVHVVKSGRIGRWVDRFRKRPLGIKLRSLKKGGIGQSELLIHCYQVLQRSELLKERKISVDLFQPKPAVGRKPKKTANYQKKKPNKVADPRPPAPVCEVPVGVTTNSQQPNWFKALPSIFGHHLRF